MFVENKSYAEAVLIKQSSFVNKTHTYAKVSNLSNLNKNSGNHFSCIQEANFLLSSELPSSSSFSSL